MQSRKQKIEAIVLDLENLKKTQVKDVYAINCNIDFFKSLYGIRSYYRWWKKVAPVLDSSRLLELSDLGLERWDKELHEQLIMASRRAVPGMITPLVEKLFLRFSESAVVSVLDLGSGGMEAERQLILKLQRARINKKYIFVGIDRSKPALEALKSNFADLQDLVEVRLVESVSMELLNGLQQQERDKHLLVVSTQDIFTLPHTLADYRFDLAFHTRFKHHLTELQRTSVDQVLFKVSKQLYEFDEYKDMGIVPVQSIFTWNRPVIMNGAIFSRLREKTKEQIQQENKGRYAQLDFFKFLGAYLKVYNN